MATTKKKSWVYHITHSFKAVETGVETSFVSQLYQVGVYAIINGDPALQFNLTPNDIVKIEKRLKKSEKEGEIKDLVFGTPIEVGLVDSLYKQIE